jgi:methylated-DNA-[protein]-cysteine S-methyltransferase
MSSGVRDADATGGDAASLADGVAGDGSSLTDGIGGDAAALSVQASVDAAAVSDQTNDDDAALFLQTMGVGATTTHQASGDAAAVSDQTNRDDAAESDQTSRDDAAESDQASGDVETASVQISDDDFPLPGPTGSGELPPSGDTDADVPVTDGFAVFDTVIGACGIAWGPAGITGVQLPEGSSEATAARLAAVHPAAVLRQPPPQVTAVIQRIRQVLAGGADDLADVPLDLRGRSEFERRAYAVARSIAPGRTLTYGQVAERIGNPGLARAVGRAMGANPFPIVVPCHRVLGADGSIGGFSAHGGAVTKRRMLLAEGVPERDGPALFGTDALYGSRQAAPDPP